MSLYAPLFRRVLYPAYESGLRRRDTFAHLARYERDQWRSPDELQALQWQRLQALIAHCWEHVPFYRQWWGDAGVGAAADIRDRDDYARLPLLTKATIRAHFDALIAPSRRDALYFKATGGSTGEPLRFGYTRESYERRVAVMHRGYGWSGAHLGQRTVYLWGAPVSAPAGFGLFKDRLYHAAFNRRMLNAFDMDERRMAEYADAIDRFRPETIIGYVGPLYELARWIERHGRTPHRPRRVLGAAEALLPHQRETIERVFGAPAYDTYGCREVMLIAAECEARDGLHVNIDHLHVEYAGEGAGTDGPRELVITDLSNDGMPLMRYLNGDLGTPGKTTCACGRGLPKLAKVDGRKLDALRTAAGRLLPGEYFVHTLMNVRGFSKYQVVQRRIDALVVRLVPDADDGPHVDDAIRAELRRLVGDSIAIEFERVERIALTASGKHRVTLCELPA